MGFLDKLLIRTNPTWLNQRIIDPETQESPQTLFHKSGLLYLISLPGQFTWFVQVSAVSTAASCSS